MYNLGGDIMEQIVELLKGKEFHLPKILITSYKKLNITDIELIVIIYLINSDCSTYNPKQISTDLDIKINDVLEIINNLMEKNIISLDIIKINNIRNEVINLDLLYEKLAFNILDIAPKEEKNTNLFEIFENELGRGLTPMEFEIINGWLEIEYSEELILCALKEAIYNGISNFRYIDRILYEWHKKGIKTKEDVEKNKREFKKSKSSNIELFDYDWLNDSRDN